MLTTVLTFNVEAGHFEDILTWRQNLVATSKVRNLLEEIYYRQDYRLFALEVWQNRQSYDEKLGENPIEAVLPSRFQISALKRYSFELALDKRRVHLEMQASTIQLIQFPAYLAPQTATRFLLDYARSSLYSADGNVGVYVGSSHETYLIRSDWRDLTAQGCALTAPAHTAFLQKLAHLGGKILAETSELLQTQRLTVMSNAHVFGKERSNRSSGVNPQNTLTQ